jgi:MFS family permease
VVLILGLICLTVPASLLPWIGSKTGVLWVRIVEGFSCGLMYPAISPIVKTLFPPGQRGLANGLLNSSVSVGNSVGVFVGPLLFAALGGAWKSMSAAISVFGWVTLVFGVVLYFAYNSKLPRHEDESADGSTFRKALFSPFTFVGIATMFMTLWASLCLYSLTASYLAADRPLGAGYGSVMAGRLILGATLLGGVLGPILCGFLLDKVFHGKVKWVFYIGFSLLCVGTYLLKSPMVTGNVVLLVAVLTLAGFGSMFAYPTIYYLIACSYPSGVVGRMSALWGGIANCGGVLGLYIAGLTIKAQGSYNTTLTLQSLMALIAFLLTIPLLRLTKRMKEDVGSEAELGVQVAE